MPTHYNRNRGKKKKGFNWDWERAVQGAISGGAAGVAGGPKGIAAGALIGGGAGGLTGRDADADYGAFDEALDHYAGRSRKDARMLSDELSADLGANLASRGINNSRLGAGIVNANRGRVMGAAQGNIDKMRADMHARIAEAEYNADMAHDANTRQGWLNLARQLGMQAMMGDFSGLFGEDGVESTDPNSQDPFPELRSPDNVEGSTLPFDPNRASSDDPFPELREYTPPLVEDPSQQETFPGDPFPELRAINPDTVEAPTLPFDPNRASTDDPFPEFSRPAEPIRGGADATMELDRQKKGATSVPPVKQDPWFAPRRDKLREALPPEEMQVLEEVFPNGELDRILDPSERSTLPDWAPTYEAPPPSEPNQRREQFGPNPGDSDYPEYMRRLYPTPEDARQDGISEEDIRIIYGASSAPPVMDVPPPSERNTLPDWAEDDGVINITPLDVDSEWATEEKMNGLPEYMGYIYDDEAGYNATIQATRASRKGVHGMA